MTTEVMAAGRDLTGAALDQFLDFAAQHPTVAMLTKAAGEMPLPNADNSEEMQAVLYCLIGAGFGYGLGVISDNLAEKARKQVKVEDEAPFRFRWITPSSFYFAALGLVGGAIYSTSK